MARGDLTDGQWAALEPLLPTGTKAGRPPVWPRRQLIDGIRFRVRTGVPWRDVPVEYGPWGRVYDLFRRWQRAGVWHRILTQLQSLADAASARGRCPQAGRPAEGVAGLHLAVEQRQKPMSVVITAGQRGDSPQFEAVLEKVRVPCVGPGRPRVRPVRVRADRAYASRKNRAYLRRRGIRCTIPDKADQTRNRKKLGSCGGRPSLRPGRLPRASRGRMRDQPPQEKPGCRNPVRQARGPLRSDRAHRGGEWL